MLVKDWMSTEIIWVDESASIQEALKLMKSHGIRHLPVRNEEGKLTGWITDSDLRGVLIASMLEEINVKDVMIVNPISINPSDHLEDAARIMVEQKIGGLPVIEKDHLVGVITVIDVLKAFLAMFGALEKTVRIDFTLPESIRTDLSKLASIVEAAGGRIKSVCKFYGNQYSIHLEEGNTSKITEVLKKQGVIVEQ